MKLISNANTMIKLFKRKQPKFGPSIFYQRNWLTKQVDAAILDQRLVQHVELGPVKEQQHGKETRKTKG